MKRILIIAVAVLLSLDASAQFLIPKGKSMVEAYGHISMTEVMHLCVQLLSHINKSTRIKWITGI